MKNKLYVILCCLIAGCQSHQVPFGASTIQLVRPSPQTRYGQIAEPLYRFYYNGIYDIVEAERYEDAEDLASRQPSHGWEYVDGLLTMVIRPTPYGVRLELTNHRTEPLILNGDECGFIDPDHNSHPVELRPPSALFPMEQPLNQAVVVPPRTKVKIDLDVIMPLYRSEILHHSRSEEERGAFVVTTAPLPVFCSGYYLYQSKEPEVQRMKQWAIGRQFGVYVLLNTPRRQFGYTFIIQPARFSTGPDADNEEKTTTSQPTPISGFDENGRMK